MPGPWQAGSAFGRAGVLRCKLLKCGYLQIQIGAECLFLERFQETQHSQNNDTADYKVIILTEF